MVGGYWSWTKSKEWQNLVQHRWYLNDTLLPETNGSLKNNGQQILKTPCVQGQAVCFKDHLLEIKHLIEISAKHGMFREAWVFKQLEALRIITWILERTGNWCL